MSANLRDTLSLWSTESPWRRVFTAELVSEQQGWALPLEAVLEDSPFAICQGQEAQHPTAGRCGATLLPQRSAPMSARAAGEMPRVKPREVDGQQEWVARWDRAQDISWTVICESLQPDQSHIRIWEVSAHGCCPLC